MKIVLKQDEGSLTRLRRDGVPSEVVNLIGDSPIEVAEGTAYTIEVNLHGRKTFWNVARECVEVVE